MRKLVIVIALLPTAACHEWRLVDQEDDPVAQPEDTEPEDEPAVDTDPSPPDTDAPSTDTDPPFDDCVDDGVDTSAPAWAWGADNPITRAEATFVGETDGDQAFYPSAPGDIDGDGTVDVVIGAANHSGAALGGGTAYFVLGGVPRIRGQEVRCLPGIHGNEPGMQLARTTRVGDLDADGLPDVLLAPGTTSVTPPGGEYLFFGRTSAWPSGDVTLADATVTRATGNIDSGPWTLADFGDFDGDGIDDWAIVGAHELGELHVVAGGAPSGSVEVPTEDILWVYGTNGARTVSVAFQAWGDLDGDERTDILVRGETAEEVWLIPATASGTIARPVEAVATAKIANDGGVMGAWIVEDVDGDGIAEAALSTGIRNPGTWLLMGGAWPAEMTVDDVDVALAPGHPGGEVTSVGDVDGDGRNDLAYVLGTSAYVMLGRAAWDSAYDTADADVHVLREVGSDDRMWVGGSLIGDLDGDGTDDLFVRLPYESYGGLALAGSIAVFHGAAGWPAEVDTATADARFVGSAKHQQLGEGALTHVEDVDGDGADDLVSGAVDSAGRGSVAVFFGKAL